ncbi:hypothetical protein DER45DRAFT_644687 [Fusarium avenaceum]|nr:hypothetical protein DER45DRAFT_644687 [Fusarium avenaceum]
MATPQGNTNDGYEIQFGTNHMGYALLTKLLHSTLKKTAAATHPPQDVRIINFASSEEARSPATEAYDLNKLKTDMASTSTLLRYVISKVANIHLARALSRHHPEIRSISLHPDVNQLWAAVSPDAKSGEFYFPVGVTSKGSKQSRDKALEDALWNWTENELKGYA